MTKRLAKKIVDRYLDYELGDLVDLRYAEPRVRHALFRLMRFERNAPKVRIYLWKRERSKVVTVLKAP